MDDQAEHGASDALVFARERRSSTGILESRAECFWGHRRVDPEAIMVKLQRAHGGYLGTQRR